MSQTGVRSAAAWLGEEGGRRAAAAAAANQGPLRARWALMGAPTAVNGSCTRSARSAAASGHAAAPERSSHQAGGSRSRRRRPSARTLAARDAQQQRVGGRLHADCPARAAERPRAARAGGPGAGLLLGGAHRAYPGGHLSPRSRRRRSPLFTSWRGELGRNQGGARAVACHERANCVCVRALDGGVRREARCPPSRRTPKHLLRARPQTAHRHTRTRDAPAATSPPAAPSRPRENTCGGRRLRRAPRRRRRRRRRTRARR